MFHAMAEPGVTPVDQYVAVHDSDRPGEANNIEKYLTADYAVELTAPKLKIFRRKGATLTAAE